jgi:iron only hydrogenase large subunit-like protein
LEDIILNRIKKKRSIALLAPSFPIDFKYPNIIGMLRELGFDKVTELTFGARMVNWWYVDYIKKNLDQKYFIASPCPTLVSYIKAKYPELAKYLMPYASPMLAQARIIRRHHPDYQIVFFSPCIAKQTLEAPKFPDVLDGVVTFKGLKSVLDTQHILEHNFNRQYRFDSLIQEYTKIYPISGGLGSTSHIHKIFKDREIFVDDTIPKIEPILKKMQRGRCKYRFLDILNCKGGCIGGPALASQEISIEERRKKVTDYIKESGKNSLGPHRGRLEYADGVEMSVEF